MKKTFRTFCMTLAISTFLIACDKDDDGPLTNDETAKIATLLQSGTWKITSHKDDRIDRTEQVRDFVFSFGAANKLTATLGTTTHTGTWSVTLDDGRSNDLDLNIFFTSPTTFRSLNEDWDIISYTNDKIILGDDDDSIDEDALIFERQ